MGEQTLLERLEQLPCDYVYRCKRCADCSETPGGHHFSDYFGDRHSEPDHPAAKLGLEMWRVCKHCPAWEHPEVTRAEN